MTQSTQHAFTHTLVTMTDSVLNLVGQPPAQQNNLDQQDSAAAGEVFGSVLYYCSLILFLPLVAFFVTRTVVLESVLGVEADSVSSNVSAAVVAVVVLHLALGLFIYRAYFTSTAPKARIGKQE